MGGVTLKDQGARPSAFAKLFYFMRPDKGKMVLSLVMACIGEALGMVPYVVIAVLAAGLLKGTLSLEAAAWLSIAAAAGQTAKFFCTWRSSMMSHGIAFRALRSMRDAMAEKMARVPMGTIVDTPTGTFKNRFVDNVNQLEDAIAHFMPELPSNVFAPMLAMAIVFAIDWRMGLAGLATIPFGVLFYLGMMRGYEVKMARYIKSEQKMNSTLVEYVNGIQVIKASFRSSA
ncbi:MAG: ABC transporter transmembrane domain-containing protein [Coriobacteriaceae bacterium]|nr:ABC transporter transmembrane domain-containing protein [Coriobacteriaceae bacterium]MDD7584980.1 ABC transporter transmembrane domain-containing protein [Coriobacteriaceae bacterium]